VHVEVFRVAGLGTAIFERPRPLSRHRRADPSRVVRYTLNCEEPQNVLSPRDSEAILAAYRTGEDPDGDGGLNVRLVALAEIEENRFDLNIGRYVRANAEQEDDLDAVIAQFAAARAERDEAERTLLKHLAAVGIEVPDA
jgi:type I restriction-modification system DNA methylase subunit